MKLLYRLRHAYRLRKLERDLVGYEIAIAELNGTEYVPTPKPVKIHKAPISWSKALGISHNDNVKLGAGGIFMLIAIMFIVFLVETLIFKVVLNFVAPAINWNIHPSFYQCMGIMFLFHFIGKFFTRGK